MKGTTTKMILIILLVLCIVGIYILLGENMEEAPVEKGYNIVKIRENLENSNPQGEMIIASILVGRASESKSLHSIKKEELVKEKFQQLDLSSDTYHSEAEEIMEKTSPNVLLQYIENQCEKAVLALGDLENREVSYKYNEKDEQGNTDILKIYDLGEGTEIVLQETDCADDSAENSREYTVSYTIIVGGTTQGKFSVTNHYNIDKNQITLTSAEAKEYNWNGPLNVELRDTAWRSSQKKASQIGDEIYTGAAFYLTCSKDAVIESAKTSSGKSRNVSWNENRTRLHKIYAAVKVKDKKEDNISAETYGKLMCLK